MIYCASDLHGDYTKYRSLLEKISLRDRDTLYILGDVIDRGPDGIKILRDMMVRPNVVPILGNHEFVAAACLGWLLDDITEESLAALGPAQLGALQGWMNNGGTPTFLAVCALSREEREEILEYIKEMELTPRWRRAAAPSSWSTLDWTIFPRRRIWRTMTWRIFSSAARNETSCMTWTNIWSTATPPPAPCATSWESLQRTRSSAGEARSPSTAAVDLAAVWDVCA